ncbi:MAG: sulfotransferase [Acidimicrobiia bacterium]|nr:sulfotransferase [Acidimicrobiia bacterium]
MSSESPERSRAEVAVREATKSLLRDFAVRTARWRGEPRFLIVGAKRGGTTSLWNYLQQYPGIPPLFPRQQKVKGTYFFDENWAKGMGWYRSFFWTNAHLERMEKHLGYVPAVGEASPYYLFHPLAPERARSVLPDARVIILLRNPADRTFSHYNERVFNETESLSFTEALEAEPERLRGEEERIRRDPAYVSFAHRHQSYLAQSKYAPMLERWLEAYPREQVTIRLSEDLYRDPQSLCDEVAAMLGLPGQRLEGVRAHAAVPAEFDPSMRAQLEERLAPDMEAVEKILGYPTGWLPVDGGARARD